MNCVGALQFFWMIFDRVKYTTLFDANNAVFTSNKNVFDI